MSDIGGFTLSVVGLDEAEELRVKSFTGSEGMSELFCFELDLVSRSPNIDFEKVLDNSATLTLIDKQGNSRSINGVIASFEQGNTGFHFTQYRAVIMPMLHRLRFRSDNRIFQNKTVVEIMEAVLKEAGVMEIDFITKDKHEPREYCVQYRETDLEFIERLAAEEGFHYSFEHSEGSHKLVFADTILGNPTIDLGGIEFNANPGGRIEESYFKTFIWRKSIRTEHFSHRDYTFKFPDNKLESMKGSGAYRKYDYPGRYKDFMVGQKFNEYQLDAERRDYAVGVITSDVVQLFEGCYFDFTGHRNDNYNKRYLVTHMDHEGSQPQVLEEDAPEGDAGKSYYHNQFEVVEYGTNWRPPRRIRPVVDGPQIAKVVGPAGEEIYTDEFGRVKVQFPWDRYGESNEHSSCWIRVSQNWAGGSWGHMAIPRIDQEVIVEFLEGDPDQPIIIGRTYHSSNRPPYRLADHKTRMTIKSKTHKGDGFNEITFEDEKDQEVFFTHAQKDMTSHTNNNRTEQIGANKHETIGANKSISVKQNHKEKIGANMHLTVGAGSDSLSNILSGALGMTSGGLGGAVSILQEELSKKQSIRQSSLAAAEKMTDGEEKTQALSDISQLEAAENELINQITDIEDLANQLSASPDGGLGTGDNDFTAAVDPVSLVGSADSGTGLVKRGGLFGGILNGLMGSGIMNVLVSRFRSDTIGIARTEQIGVSKNTTVGSTQTTTVGKHKVVVVGERLEIVVGNGESGCRIVMDSEGNMALRATKNIHVEGLEHIQLTGLMDLN